MRVLPARLAVLLLLAGCTAQAPPSVDAQGPVGPRSQRPSPAADLPDVAPKTGRLTLAFAGDVHFEDALHPRLDDPEAALDPAEDLLGDADIAMVNLETAITDRGAPEPKKYRFRTSPAALDALAAAGVDVVTMANNHAVDYGADGLADTLAAQRSSPVPVVGIGRNAAQAFAPAILDVRGTKVAVLAATQVPDRTAAAWAATDKKAGVAVARNPRRLVQAVRKAAKRNDLVVVYLHYGTERVACPTDEQRDIVDALVEAGADVVVGSHAHVLLGSGWHGPAYVDYGLGNFVWYSPNSRAEASSGVLRLTVAGHRVTRATLLPTFTGQDGLPRPLVGAEATKARAAWRALRKCTGLAARAPR
jgi:poly-gamma-glutamate capsule biosynthesis protein CapA/YwtB (metallophosphatase superfamily)